jgi:hypothetical protein
MKNSADCSLRFPFLIIFVSCNREGDRESEEDRYSGGDGDMEGDGERGRRR